MLPLPCSDLSGVFVLDASVVMPHLPPSFPPPLLSCSALGGVFVLDASAAMPHGGCEFMLQQLASCLDHWYHLKPEDPPQYNVLLVAGEVVQVRRVSN